jgi:Zn-dependent alcohol dehydrogenase
MSDTMWAARLVHPSKPLEFSRVAIPEPRSGELLLKLEA